ncbi:MAG: acyl-CoA dehydrogenase family protein [Myxococcota bacterium]|jgi:acyl-CoA dehydrogenase|nr:acyl-CoA dehydrogenase family protein [Myxococcota bacterium]
MADIETFRSETRSWLEANAPESLRHARGSSDALEGHWGGRNAEWATPDHKAWAEIMADKQWTAPMWPTEYGGGGLSKQENKVLTEEMGRLGLPAPLTGFGFTMIGPVLLRFGNEEQKKEHLPKICRGEIRWCQGYSEPGAGSDLASLQCKAVREGDEFVINGQKIWTSYADKSDWIFALVRTDPDVKKQEGITFILIDMETPGVSVKPIQLISGKSPFCETFFADVHAPVSNVIHEINAGWTVAKALLGHERTMISQVFGGATGARKGRGRLVEMAAKYLGEEEGGRLADPVYRNEVAQMEMDVAGFRYAAQRMNDEAKAGHQPGAESSMFKVVGTENNMKQHELMVRLAGPQGIGWEGEGFEDDELDLTRAWLRTRGNSIEGGTSEIQLNIIAKHVLGLSG